MNRQQSERHGWRHEAFADDINAHRHGLDLEVHNSLREGLYVVRKGVLGLFLWIASCVSLTGWYLSKVAPEFVATSQIVLEPRRLLFNGSAQESSNYNPTMDNSQADSQVQIVKSEHTLRAVFDDLDLQDNASFLRASHGLAAMLTSSFRRSASSALHDLDRERNAAFQAFSDRVTVRRISQSYVLEISFRGPSASQAAQIANSVTASYMLDNIVYQSVLAQRGTEIMQSRAAEIKEEQAVANAAIRTGSLPTNPFPDSSVRVISGAVEPLNETYPQIKLYILLAFVSSLGSGIGLMLVRHKLDGRIRFRYQLAHLTKHNDISVLPEIKSGKNARIYRSESDFSIVVSAPHSDFAESMRVLRTAVLSGKRHSRHFCIGVASWLPSEGRSSIASNFAFVVALVRERVILVDADFGSARLSRSFAPQAVTGLSEALLSHDVSAHSLTVPLTSTLDFVPASGGVQSVNHDIFIGSSEMERLVRSLHGNSDVVIDLPAMSVSSDTQAIGPLLDGVILVVDASKATKTSVLESVRHLDRFNIPVIRIILNRSGNEAMNKL